jgi:hypothetical protein
MTEGQDNGKPVELAVSDRYAAAHGWVLTAITGFLSAYYLEDPRVRFARRYRDAEAGAHVWVCDVEEGMPFMRVVRRLQADIPPGRVQERTPASPRARYTLDLPEPDAASSS